MSSYPKQQVIAQIHHQETDRIPYTLTWEDETIAERLDQHYGSTAWRGLVDSAIRQVDRPTAGMGYGEKPGEQPNTVMDVYGCTWQLDKLPPHQLDAPLKKPSLEGYVFPDVESCFDPDWEERVRRQIEAQKDYFIVCSFGRGLFERSWTLRGFENSMMDAAAYPDFYDELIEQITRHHMAVLERVLKLPLDGFKFNDDWGYQEGVLLGAKRWRKILKPRLARLYAQVHAAGKYVLSHCCGSIAEILPDLIEIGLDVYESVQPEARNNSPYELKRQFGDKITFWGGLGSQSTIAFGTPDEIHAEVSRLCREMGKGGGYILGPAKPLRPETPVENAAAVVESFVRQAGVPFA
jgi:uroporphyrinogen decarboxylase